MADETPAHLTPQHRRGMAVKMIKKKLVEMSANEEDATTAKEIADAAPTEALMDLAQQHQENLAEEP